VKKHRNSRLLASVDSVAKRSKELVEIWSQRSRTCVENQSALKSWIPVVIRCTRVGMLALDLKENKNACLVCKMGALCNLIRPLSQLNKF
jgi:hypothetical protein